MKLFVEDHSGSW